jgi:hypothetical protein
MRPIFYLPLLFLCSAAYAQQEVSSALENDNKSLNKRFEIMVSNSQNFTDYKVIKESYLRDFWKMVKDSVHVAHTDLKIANDTIASLNKQIELQNENLKQAENEMAEMEHDSTHINAYGLDLHKGLFLTVFLVVVGGLGFLVVALYGRQSLLQRSYDETASTLNEINEEFMEHKRKSLDKQMKLSRELQDERNKLEEISHGRFQE